MAVKSELQILLQKMYAALDEYKEEETARAEREGVDPKRMWKVGGFLVSIPHLKMKVRDSFDSVSIEKKLVRFFVDHSEELSQPNSRLCLIIGEQLSIYTDSPNKDLGVVVLGPKVITVGTPPIRTFTTHIGGLPVFGMVRDGMVEATSVKGEGGHASTSGVKRKH